MSNESDPVSLAEAIRQSALEPIQFEADVISVDEDDGSFQVRYEDDTHMLWEIKFTNGHVKPDELELVREGALVSCTLTPEEVDAEEGNDESGKVIRIMKVELSVLPRPEITQAELDAALARARERRAARKPELEQP